MWLIVVGLAVGVVAGFYLPLEVPVFYTRYLSIALLAALDSTFGGFKAGLQGTFNNMVFISGFFGNAMLAALLTYIGDRLGVELYYAALFAMGVRVFQNLGVIRRLLLREWTHEK